MTRILLIRHGSTDLMSQMLCGRTEDIHLNATGRAETDRVAAEIRHRYDLDAVFCSPVTRAVETAEIIARRYRLRIRRHDAFAEVDFGSWTGKRFDELTHIPAWHDYNERRSLVSVPDGESFLDVQRRAWSGIQSLLADWSGKSLAIVTHADVIRAVLVLVLGIPPDLLVRLVISPAGFSEINIENHSTSVVTVNQRA